MEQLQRWREDREADAASLLLGTGRDEEEAALVAEEEAKLLRELEDAKADYQV